MATESNPGQGGNEGERQPIARFRLPSDEQSRSDEVQEAYLQALADLLTPPNAADIGIIGVTVMTNFREGGFKAITKKIPQDSKNPSALPTVEEKPL